MQGRCCTRTLVAAISLLLSGACADGGLDRVESGPDEPKEVAESAELECVTYSYPCTWIEVDPAVLERTQTVADEAFTRLERGEGTDRTAVWLESLSDIGHVLSDSLMIRFRVREGRPVWVGTPRAAELGMRGAGAPHPPVLQQGSARADPVGPQAPGVRPEKSVLFLDPYRWEFYTDVLHGLVPVNDDASFSLPRIFRGARDYNCTPGKPCACPGGTCFHYVGNDWSGRCDLTLPSCGIDQNVTLEHFKSWAQYDVIHVASHGSALCDKNGFCGGGIASGRLVRGDFKAWSEALQRAGQRPPGADWLTEPGIELVLVGLPAPLPVTPLTICNRLTPGTPGHAYALCNSGQRVYREYLGTDFFKAHYSPGDLKDKLIFLSSCSSVMGTAALAKYLAGPGSENAVVGWDDLVLNGSASRAASVFYDEWLTGKTAHAAFIAVKNDIRYTDLAFVGGRGIVRGGASVSAAQASTQTEGLAKKRGVETVRLFDPTTDREVADGGPIPLLTQPGDGQPDTLDALLEVVSLDSAEVPSEYMMRVRVAGRDAPGTARFNIDAGSGTHRYRGSIDLGFDLAPGQPVDVEVSADLPDGGETRWLYYDMVPNACSVPSQGQYTGDLGGALARRVGPGARGAFAKILRSPLGGWGLQIEAREQGEELNFLIQLPDDPVPGGAVTVTDTGILDGTISGGVRNPERIGWLTGDLDIRFTAVRPRPGQQFTWVCGTISGTLVGGKEDPNARVAGAGAYIQVPATFNGQFWAEWYPNR